MRLEIFASGAVWRGYGYYEPGIDAELLPCPFCGSAEIEISNNLTPAYAAGCTQCHSLGSQAGPDEAFHGHEIKSLVVCERLHEQAFINAIKLWNRRDQQAGHGS